MIESGGPPQPPERPAPQHPTKRRGIFPGLALRFRLYQTPYTVIDKYERDTRPIEAYEDYELDILPVSLLETKLRATHQHEYDAIQARVEERRKMDEKKQGYVGDPNDMTDQRSLIKKLF